MRKNKLMRSGALALSIMMLAGTMTGCGKKEDSTKETTAAASSEQAAAPAEFSYPMSTDETLTYWMELNSNVAANFNNIGDTTFGKKLQEATGITVEFQHPAVGQVAEQFNLLLSNRTLPDVIEYSWLTYGGGPQKAIEDGVIIPLNDIIDQYCPNLKAYLEANPDID